MTNITVNHYSGWFGVTETELTIDDNGFGVIDEDAERAFTRGQCHSLAVAIHKETGWPIYGLYTAADNGTSPSHCLVYCPQLDDYVDIKGLGAINRLNEFPIYRKAKRKEVTTNEIESWKRAGYLPVNCEAAKPFAKTILKEINKEISLTTD